MTRTAQQLRRDALAIWQAGVAAVRSESLIRKAVSAEGSLLRVGDEEIELAPDARLAVVGAGKAGAGMALGIEEALGENFLRQHQACGWVNVPADCRRPTRHIHLHPARPAGVNEPTAEAAAGAAEILQRLGQLRPQDVCLCLISGGGSALLPAPVAGISLQDKLAVTRHLSAAGANIEQLNTVRKQLSQIKGGGLARACRAGTLVALIISDVLGDPLDIISSGPTVPDTGTPQDALAVLEQFQARQAPIATSVFEYLQKKAATGQNRPEDGRTGRPSSQDARVINLVIGNNATAVDAAGLEAVRLGYSPAMISARASEGAAEEVGRHLAGLGRQMRVQSGPDCLVSGGEPTVRLAPASRRGLGGRNQQLVLAAIEALGLEGAAGLLLLSGGTDGEDGPTDAAGAWADAETIAASQRLGLDPADFLARNDAYRFFQRLQALIRTGPTHTNVCDLRVVLVDRENEPPGG